ncbi:hypothetical protein [Nocardia sp. NBC_01329]|uniref:hypothetical protein n=1 Tax=Nocardia sp. NBC_01329 TaxID=2903594 RepID=UPI002E156FE6|nr:hypothetical protein OG405_08240 [Nocardia sp. NBC_01329]
MSDRDELIDAIVSAIDADPGARPAAPLIGALTPWRPRNIHSYAVDLGPVIEVRVVATLLPLPPMYTRLTSAVRALLTGTPWEHTELRLVVTELDAAAFTASPTGRAESSPADPSVSTPEGEDTEPKYSNGTPKYSNGTRRSHDLSDQ